MQDVKMRAVVLSPASSTLSLQLISRPRLLPGHILIRLEASGICHTDVHVWRGQVKPPHPPEPFVLGHEGVGRVVAVAEGVRGWDIGQRAGAGWLQNTCGHCAECADGAESFCQQHQAHGFNVPGCFAEYVAVPGDFAVPLPEGDATQLAPLLCAGLTAYGALQRAKLRKAETCMIFGAGGLGLYAVQLAVRLGAQVIAVDPDANKRALALSYGAVKALDPTDTGFTASLQAHKAHVCINFAPTPNTWPAMIAAIRPRGRIIAAAIVSEPVPLDQEWLTGSGVEIMGTSVGTRQQMRELMSLHQQKPLVCTVTRVGLEGVADALLNLHNGNSGNSRFCIEM